MKKPRVCGGDAFVPWVQPAMSVSGKVSVLFLLFLLFATVVAQAKGPEPPLRLPLETIGFEQPGAGAMTANPISTVTFLDEQHLLVTYAVRRLMKRLPDDPPDDQDHTIEAVVVNLPSGDVSARTEWRVHDAGQYLWNLGAGRLLLRVRNTLTTIAPLANLARGDPFLQYPLLHSKQVIAALLLSPDRDLLTVETVDKRPTADPQAKTTESIGDLSYSRTQLNFYRLLPSPPGKRITAEVAGIALADEPINISLTSEGHLEVSEESKNVWHFDFTPYEGKYLELAAFETSCRPHGIFVSSSEFVAFGCRGRDELLTLGGFDLSGQQMWQQSFTDSYAFPSFVMVPAVGRFALSRDLVSSGMTPGFSPASITTQEIRVYQTYSGKQLLRVEASPVQRAGGNYDLSPEGLRFAVIREGAIEVYPLPALTAADVEGVRRAKTLVPPMTRADVRVVSHKTQEALAKAAVGQQQTSPHMPAPAQPVNEAPSSTASVPGEKEPVPVVSHRKPPTIYTLPTDRPEEPPQPQ